MSGSRDINTTATLYDEGDSVIKLTSGLEVVALSNDFETAVEREVEESFEHVDAGYYTKSEDFVIVKKADADQERDDRIKAQRLAIAEEEVKNLSHTALLEYCAQKLNTNHQRRATASEFVMTLLISGIEVLDALSRMWSSDATADAVTDTAASPYWKFTNIQATIYALSNEEQLSFYRVFDALESIEAIQDPKTVWALQLGLRGIAIGWKLGMKSPEILLAAEKGYLAGVDVEEKKAIERFATSLRIWSKEVSKYTEAKKKLVTEDKS